MKYSLLKNMIYVYKKTFHYNPKLKISIPLQMLCAILIPIFTSLIPSIAVGLITRNENIVHFLLGMGAITIVFSFILYLNSYLSTTINNENTISRIREFYLVNNIKLMTTDYVNVEPQEKQILIQKSLNSLGSNWVGPEFMMKNSPNFIVNILGLILYTLLISSFNYVIILILILMSILNYLLTLYARNYEEHHKKVFVKYDRQINYLFENSTSLTNGKDVRIYRMETWFYNIFKGLIKKRIHWNKNIEYRYFLPSLSDNILLLIRDVIAYGILITSVMNKEIDITTFTFFIGIIGGFSLWLNNAVTAYSNLKRANLGVNDYRAYYEIEEVFNHGEGCEIPSRNELPISIEFKNVSFRYPGSETFTLKDINFKIEGGSKIALVGINGAGKTTLVKLLSGLYYPTEGDIYVNGKSIESYNIEDYYNMVGAVFQDVEILPFSIKKNVALQAEKDIDLEKVIKSLELAGLKDKVNSLKNKENTYLTQTLDKEGILLSGGEMQKLMLARALYKNAPIMVLDEPTAALDPIAESELYEKYNDLTKDNTSIFISHRLSSTKFCDRILFLENGQILEDGTHHELMLQGGKYSKMFDIQSHYYKENLEVAG